MSRVYVGIGSNLERYRHVAVALDELTTWFGALDISPVYESEAVGFCGSEFLNLVVGVETDLSVSALHHKFKQLEADRGRCPGAPRFSPRTLDLDILTYDNLVGEVDGVVLPRPEILRNAFVLRPLADIAPEVRHPVCGRSYAGLWHGYTSGQKLWPVDFSWHGQLISAAVC